MELLHTAFKAYDIRGKYPAEVNEELAYRLGKAFCVMLGARRIAIGHDIRLSGNSLQEAIVRGVREMGCDVVDIGQCGTEMIYFATAHLKLDGGIMVTASHNPKDYNGMKLVREGARPISADTGLKELEEAIFKNDFPAPADSEGKYEAIAIADDYVRHLLGYIDQKKLRPLKLVVNAGNGAAGPILDKLEGLLPFEFVAINNEPDGNFPHGVPNPLLIENRAVTQKAVIEHGADLGVAFDGDFDRCFIFDETGEMIEGYYIVGFLAHAFLQREKGAKIIYDPRLVWNTLEIAKEAGGTAIMCKSGHAFIKDKMRRENAIYGGEMSAHNYFRDFTYCDSGMITWLLVAELLCKSGKKLSHLLKERMERYPISGEINSTVKDADAILREIEGRYGKEGKIDHTDGLSVEFDKWRFNLRKSNTEPVIRLNVETRGDKELLTQKTQELLSIIRA